MPAYAPLVLSSEAIHRKHKKPVLQTVESLLEFVKINKGNLLE